MIRLLHTCVIVTRVSSLRALKYCYMQHKLEAVEKSDGTLGGHEPVRISLLLAAASALPPCWQPVHLNRPVCYRPYLRSPPPPPPPLLLCSSFTAAAAAKIEYRDDSTRHGDKKNGLHVGMHVRVEDTTAKNYGEIGRICTLQQTSFKSTANVSFDDVETGESSAMQTIVLDAYGRHKKTFKPRTTRYFFDQLLPTNLLARAQSVQVIDPSVRHFLETGKVVYWVNAEHLSSFSVMQLIFS